MSVDLKEHLLANMWKPVLFHMILQLSWLIFQLKFEFSSWLFYAVTMILFGLLMLWPTYEIKRLNYVSE